ncbi:MAG: fumarylacetoacetate hydrolase family protein [Pseudomonadota bacterium]
MKLLTFTHDGATRIGALRGENIVDLHAADPAVPADMVELLQGGDALMARAKAAAESGDAAIALADVKLESPVLKPPRVLAIGLNYEAHFDEIPDEIKQKRGLTLPTTPIMFNKQNTSVNGPYDGIHLPPESEQLDYEGELGVVIGKTARRVDKANAFDVVAGYTIIDDVTIRDWQRAAMTMTMGKSWDSHCPMGPVLVTKDELTAPETLQVTVTVDGEEKQNFNTGEMLFDIATLIEYMSTAFTLVPGDVIATGTSAGVALFRDGQPWLREGQVVRVDIEQIGFIENKVVKDDGVSYIR